MMFGHRVRLAHAVGATVCFGALLSAPAPARANDAGLTPAPPNTVAVAADGGIPGSIANDSGVIMVPVPTEPSEMPEVSAAASAEEVELAKPFYVFITVEHVVNTQVNLPASVSFGGTFDVLRHTSSASISAAGKSVRQFELEVVAWDVGEFLLPPLAITYVVSGAVYSVPSSAIPIRVRSHVGDGDETLKGISPPVSVYRRDLTILYIILAAAGFALLTFLGFLLLKWRRRRRRPRRQPRPVHVPRGAADIEALERLDELQRTGCFDRDDRKPAYLGMSDIVRDFLGRRFGVPALDLTTAEIAQRMAAHPEGGIVADPATHWLEEVALVKYANEKPSSAEARAALERAKELIVSSRGLAERLAEERMAAERVAAERMAAERVAAQHSPAAYVSQAPAPGGGPALGAPPSVVFHPGEPEMRVAAEAAEDSVAVPQGEHTHVTEVPGAVTLVDNTDNTNAAAEESGAVTLVDGIGTDRGQES